MLPPTPDVLRGINDKPELVSSDSLHPSPCNQEEEKVPCK